MTVNSVAVFLYIPSTIMKIFGAWVAPEKNVLLNRVYSYTAMLMPFNFLLCEVIFTAQVWGDLDEVSEAANLIFTMASLCYKEFIFIVNQKYLVKMLEIMQCETFLPQNKEQERILNHRALIIRRLCTFSLTSAMTTCTLWTVIPLIGNDGKRSFPYKIWRHKVRWLIRSINLSLWIISQPAQYYPNEQEKLHTYLISNGEENDCVPNQYASNIILLSIISSVKFLHRMPISPERSPQYELGYIFQTVSNFIAALLYIGIDSTAISLIMFACAQLEIIMDNLKKIQPAPLSLKVEDREILIKDSNDQLRGCIKHLQVVIRFMDTLENSYHSYVFVQLCATVGIICVIGLRIMMVDPNSMKFFSMLNYMTTMLAQLFLFCWCGNELTILSQDLRDQLYQSPWYDQDRNFKRLLMFTLLRLENPILFKAGHYIPLSRPTFVSVLRLSYSYFAVLNQSKGK